MWTKRDSKTAFDGKRFSVHVDSVTMSDGTDDEYAYITMKSPGVAVVAVSESGVVLINEYKYPLNQFVWQVPKGTVEPGEGVHAAARRELSEETGIDAETFEDLGVVYSQPTQVVSQMHIILARSLMSTEPRREAQEYIKEVTTISCNDALRWIMGGRIRDAVSIAALCMALQVMRHG